MSKHRYDPAAQRLTVTKTDGNTWPISVTSLLAFAKELGDVVDRLDLDDPDLQVAIQEATLGAARANQDNIAARRNGHEKRPGFPHPEGPRAAEAFVPSSNG